MRYNKKLKFLFLHHAFLLFSVSYAQTGQLTFLEEGSFHKLNETTPLNRDNRILEQSQWDNYLSLKGMLRYRMLTASFTARSQSNDIDSPSHRFRIKELFADFSLSDAVELSIGKKIYRWGTGYAFNPTGIVEPQKDPADPSDRLNLNEGRLSAAMDFYTEDISLTIVYLNDAAIVNGNFEKGVDEIAFRVYTLFQDVDISLIAGMKKKNKFRFGGNFAAVLGNNLEIHGEIIGKRGTDKLYHSIIADENSQPFYSSYPYVAFRKNSNQIYFQGLFGGQFTLNNGTNLAVEYYYNKEGLNGKEWKRWRKLMGSYDEGISDRTSTHLPVPDDVLRFHLLWGLNTLSPRGTMRHYLFSRLYQSYLSTSIELIQMLNLHDRSMLFIPQVVYRFNRRVSAYGQSIFFLGSRTSEYGMLFNRFSLNIGWRLSF